MTLMILLRRWLTILFVLLTATVFATAAESKVFLQSNGLTRGVTSLPLAAQSFSFDANDRLNTDSYDANGNTLLGAGFSQLQPDQYDFENRLVSRVATVNGQATTINLWYDGDGNRVKKTVVTPTNSVTTFYVVDELNPSGYAQVLEEHVSLNSQPSTINTVFTYGHTLTFVRTRLERAADPQGQWKNVAPEVQARATQLLEDIKSGEISQIEGFKADVFLPPDGVYTSPVTVNFNPW